MATQGYQEALKIKGEQDTAVTWLHVSDFHLTDGGTYNQQVILKSLVESVKQFRKEGHQSDLIFATGDIAASGKAKEYEPATKFFDDLLEAAGLDRSRLFLVPGNHDVDRRMGKGLARTLFNENEADDYFDPETPHPHLTQKLQSFTAWYNSYFSGIRSFPTDTSCSPVEIVQIRQSRVAILPMNSALFCIDDADHDKLFIGRRCLDSSKEELEKLEADLKIALLHHLLEWLSAVERSNIKATLGKSVDLLLHGHLHEAEIESIVSSYGGYLKLAAGAAWQTRQWPNTAMYATFNRNEVTIFPIRYQDRPLERWTFDTSLFPSPSYIGKFTIPNRVMATAGAATEASYQEEQYAEAYHAMLKEELNVINLLGTHALENIPVELTNTFVSLRLSDNWRSGEACNFDTAEEQVSIAEHQKTDDRFHSPEEVMSHVFQKKRLLLVIGDPGSGKTTLLKHYALTSLDNNKYKKLGFTVPVLVFFLPLRDLIIIESNYAPLSRNLFEWSEGNNLDISEQQFISWLKNSTTLILLDGLDEISDPGQRIKACGWIDRIVSRYIKARVVVTSRATGYRKAEGIELSSLHTRADVMDFTPHQQSEFLVKWFNAAFEGEVKPASQSPEKWESSQKQKASRKAETIISFLEKEENRSLQQLARVPMLLQIMAIIWKKTEYLPRTRVQLYDAALNYLLDYRDRQKEIEPLLPADDALCVLAPVSLWMQEVLQKDEVDRNDMQQQMQSELKTLENRVPAKDFCNYLVNRVGLLVEYRKNEYLFRHKSFREYMAALQLSKELREADRIRRLAEYFGNDWWEEPLRFFIGMIDAKTFDSFMRELFDADVSTEFTQKQQDLLELLVKEAPQKKLDSLENKLLDKNTSANKQRYLLSCLKAYNKPEALALIDKFNRSGLSKEKQATDVIKDPLGAKYIRIPAGKFIYSVTEKAETVEKRYFGKYTVTNQQYRRFISYLDGKEVDFQERLAVTIYQEQLWQMASPIKEFTAYLKDEKSLVDRFVSEEDDNKLFNKDEQPVVGVSWYAAKAYCLWLSLLESNGKRTDIYRLPHDKEWEWAAGGQRDKPGQILTVREYPWGNHEPTPKLANYNSNEGQTTQVGRYPNGATPEGLYDMAGNVWEWVEDWYDNEIRSYRVLRGGSWYYSAWSCRSAFRRSYIPDRRYSYIGFRLVFVP